MNEQNSQDQQKQAVVNNQNVVAGQQVPEQQTPPPPDVGGINDLPLATRMRLSMGGFGPQKTRLVKIIVGLFIFIIILFIISTVVNLLRRRQKAQPSPTPTPTVAPTEVPVSLPSRYATDSGVLKIEQDVKDFDSDLNKTNLHDPDLRVPDIYFDKRF